jgi:mannose-6-phosphate isomerase-like protein (cupin superfamily)
MKLLATLLLCAGFALPAGDPEGFHVWKAAELKSIGKTLAPKVSETHTATQPIPGLGNYSFITILRTGTAAAEFHETQADIFVVETGEATLVIGGKLVDEKTTAPHEIRGSGITGGTERKLAPGDIVSIPAKIPHQLKVDAGKQFAYFIVKVTQ